MLSVSVYTSALPEAVVRRCFIKNMLKILKLAIETLKGDEKYVQS